MFMKMSLNSLFLTFLFASSNFVSILTKCHLDPEKVEEIHSHKHTVKKILDDIRFKHGAKMYREYTKFIDKFGPRFCGTEVLEDSIDYMVNLTKKYNVHDIITEQFPVPYWERGFESLEMLSPFNKKMDLLGLGYSVSTPEDGIFAEAIVVKDFNELNDLPNEKVQGKIIVYNAPYTNYMDTAIYRNEGASQAALKGAVASLVRSVTPFSLYTPHAGIQTYHDNVNKIPCAAITVEDAELLQRLQDENNSIILNLFMSNDLSVKRSRNTIIDLQAELEPKKQVIVSGHIDTWDVGTGAMDDGGGMFISWFAPVILHHLKIIPKHKTLRAVLWTCEEMGLIGAKDYLKRREDKLSDINIMMESDDGTFQPLGIEVIGNKEAQCIVEEILTLFDPINEMKPSVSAPSDVSIFVERGVPGASLMTKNERQMLYHHSKADTLTVQNKEDVINCAAFWAAFAYVVAELSFDIPRG